MSWKTLLALLVLVLAPSSLFTVDRTEYVYLTQFGRHLATYDGGDDSEAGLHVKWPWPIQSVQRLDRRLQSFDLPPTELLTSDTERKTIDKTLTVDAYICWRIADREGVDQFLRSVGTPAGAQAILGQRINSELGAAIGQMALDDLISTDASKKDPKRGRVDVERQGLHELLLRGHGSESGRSLQEAARQEYGIEVVDIRLRRTNHPPAVREAIFERIRSERGKKVADYQSEGNRLAQDIKSAGERRVSEMKAQAEAEAIRQRGLADAEADRIRGEAQRKDPQFYTFLKKLEEYQRILAGDGKSTLLLSTHREMFDLLFQPPGSTMPSGKEPARTAEAGAKPSTEERAGRPRSDKPQSAPSSPTLPRQGGE
jgi:membrane protease subunit HflC